MSDVPKHENAKQDAVFFSTKTREPSQENLFSTEDLIIPQSVLSLKKAVSAIHAYPASHSKNHTLNTQRLFDACILIVQMDIRKRRDLTIEKIRDERVSPMFETRITDLVRLAGIPGKNYERVYKDLDQLYEMSLHWNVVGEDNEVEMNFKSHFFSLLGIGVSKKRGLIRFAIDPAILAIILEPTNWATLSMQVLKSLKNKGAHSLYSTVYRYVGTQQKWSAQLSVETWINLIAGHSRYIKTDEKTGESVVNYREFKRCVLVPAIAQINEHPALNYTIKLHERKSGYRISALQFSFHLKQQAPLELPITWSEDAIKVLNTIGFTDAEIADLSQVHTQDEIIEALSRLPVSEAVLKKKNLPLTSRKAYFKGILANIHAEFTPELDAQKISEEAEKKAAEEAADARKAKLAADFAEHQRQRFDARLFELDEAERQALFDRYEASAEGKRSRQFIDKGWKVENRPLMAMFQAWAKKEAPELEERLLPFPEDRDLDAWRDWKIAG